MVYTGLTSTLPNMSEGSELKVTMEIECMLLLHDFTSAGATFFSICNLKITQPPIIAHILSYKITLTCLCPVSERGVISQSNSR